nr:peritrophin-48-like [Aedes albopictus]
MIQRLSFIIILSIISRAALANECTDAGLATVDGFLSHKTECSKYISCYKGQAYEVSCPAGFNFNPDLKKCDPKYVCVVNNCPSTGIVKLPVNGSCTQYTLCIGGVQYPKECQTDLAFDSATGNCVPAAELQCMQNQCDPAAVPPQFYVNSFDCMKYYICDEKYEPIEFQCANGTIFDATVNKCILGAACPAA